MVKDRIAAIAAHRETQPSQPVSRGAQPPLSAAERAERRTEKAP